MNDKQEIDSDIDKKLDELLTKMKGNSEIIESIGEELNEADKSGRLLTQVQKLKPGSP